MINEQQKEMILKKYHAIVVKKVLRKLVEHQKMRENFKNS